MPLKQSNVILTISAMAAISIGLTGYALFKSKFNPSKNINYEIYGPPSMSKKESTEGNANKETNDSQIQ